MIGFKPLSEDGFYGWVNVAAAAIFMFTLALMMYTFSLFLPEWVKEFGWKYEKISYALTISMIVMSFSMPLVGMFIVKYGARRSIILGSSITIIGIFILANVNHLWQLYLGHGVVVAIGVAMAGSLAITTTVNNWFSQKRSLALSITSASMGLAGIIVVPIVTWMILTVGWRNTYLIIAPIYLVFALIIPGSFLRNKPEDLGQVVDGKTIKKPGDVNAVETPDKKEPKLYRTTVDFTVKEAFKTRTLWCFLTFQVLNWVSMGGIMGHGFSFLNDIGIPAMEAGFFMGLVSATMVTSQLIVGFLGLKFNMHKLVLLGCTGVIISYILMVFADASIVIVYTYGAFAGIGMGVNGVSMMNLIPNYFGAKHYPKIISLTSPIGTLIGSIGAPLCGFIRDTTGSYFLYWKIAAVLMTIGLFCLLFAGRPEHPSLRESSLDRGEPQSV